MEHNHHNHHNHEHHGSKIHIIMYLVALTLFGASFLVKNTLYHNILNALALVLSGYHVISEGILDTIKKSFKNKKFLPNIHILMTFAAIGAIIIGNYMEATMLILIFAGAHYLEHFIEGKSRSEITKLLKLNPTKARAITLDNDTYDIVDVSDLEVGQLVKVLIGDQIPTDGYVSEGFGLVDESAMTGEFVPVSKKQGDFVYGSTINVDGDFIMRVAKRSDETVYSKIVKMVDDAQHKITPTARFIRKFEPKYVTAVLLLSPIFYLIGVYLMNWGQVESFNRTMIFLTVASPCALAVADIPSTLSALSNLARHGVLFKGGSYIPLLADLDVIALDKTGTITEGKPRMVDIYFYEHDDNKNELYRTILVGMESKSNHPFAKAVLDFYQDVPKANVSVDNIIGKGLQCEFQGLIYKINKNENLSYLTEEQKEHAQNIEKEGHTISFLSVEQKTVIMMVFKDIVKNEAKEAIDYFKKNDIKTALISGDSENSVKAVAEELSIDEVYYNVLPEQKNDVIVDLKRKFGVVAMLGDGINDSPALATADIGIAMGSGTDVAIEVADGVLVKGDLDKIVYAHKVAKNTKINILQNIIFSLSVVVFLIAMNFLNLISLPIAVILHEGSTVMVILNGLRMLKKIKKEV